MIVNQRSAPIGHSSRPFLRKLAEAGLTSANVGIAVDLRAVSEEFLVS